MPFIMALANAPGYRRNLATNSWKISLIINWKHVTSIGVVHFPLLHGILKRGIWKTMKEKYKEEAIEDIKAAHFFDEPINNGLKL